MAFRSPAAIAATSTPSATVPSASPLRAGSGTGHPVVCISGLPRAAASHRGRLPFSGPRFHLVYTGQQKWFRGAVVLFRRVDHDETICREQGFPPNRSELTCGHGGSGCRFPWGMTISERRNPPAFPAPCRLI